MKRIFITSVAVLACVFNVNAQLVVDSLGRVGIGTETPKSDLQIGSDGLPDATVNIDGEKQYGLNIYNFFSEKVDGSAAIKVSGRSRSKKGAGINVSAIGLNNDSTSLMIGVCSRATNSGGGNAVGVLGARLGISNNFAGIYGSVIYSGTPTFQYPGRYAGYFYGNVLATGRIYGNVYSLTSVPKSSANAKVQSLGLNSGSEESISDKLFSVQTVQFMQEEMVDQPASDAALAMAKKDLTDIEQMDFDEETEEDIKTEMVKHYGLDGAQLKAVFPELVDEDSQGNYRINYSEMVPLLLQSIRELSARVEELEGEKNGGVQRLNAKATSIESESTDIVRMSQNKPNPFSESSVITLSIPEGTKSAAIYIYDLSGKQVKNIPVDKRGKTDITVYASDLSEGMFVYSLVTDGTVAATRRMMVVKN